MMLATVDRLPAVRYTLTGFVFAAIPYWGTTYAEGIKDLKGQAAADVPSILERRRQEVLDRLVVKATKLGADAVIGVRMDTREITQTWRELCAYGTAIVILGPL